MLKLFTRACAVSALGLIATSATGANLARQTEAAPVRAPVQAMSPPIVNWAAPQFFNAPHGAFSSDGSFGSKPVTKQGGTARTVATFIPVTPCRLVDTRGWFNPIYVGSSERDASPLDPAPRAFDGTQNNAVVPPGSLGNATTGEYRIYKAVGKCNIPAGNNRVTAVSIAVTTLPTGVSGDVEVTPTGQRLGWTVLMVIQAQLWNSAATEVSLDASGNFTVQMRTASGDMAIDVNGYYAIMDPANTSDYFSILGNYNFDGGLFSVTQTGASGAIGAAINAVGNGSEVHLAQNSNAVDIVTGGIRIRQTSPTSAPAYVFSTAGRRCTDLVAGTNTLARLDNLQAVGAGLGGVMIFAQPRTSTSPAVSVVYGTCANPSDPTPDAWYLYNSGGFAGTEQYNILIVKP